MTRVVAMVLAAITLTAVQVPKFHTAVDAVNVDVLVLDGKRPVSGLRASDFELRDSGVPQKVQAVALDDVPISLLVALDTSSSVAGDVLEGLKEASAAAIATLRPADRGALVLFSTAVTIRSQWESDRSALVAAIGSARAGGLTSLYDASFTSLLIRDEKPGQRNLAIVFSDGDDTASWLPEPAVLDKAHRTDAVLYAVVMSASGRPDQPALHLDNRSGVALAPPARAVGNGFLSDLTEATGGERFVVQHASALRPAFTRIVTDFRSRYVLSYMPEGVGAHGWHPIDVKVAGRTLGVRARRGYTR